MYYCLRIGRCLGQIGGGGASMRQFGQCAPGLRHDELRSSSSPHGNAELRMAADCSRPHRHFPDTEPAGHACCSVTANHSPEAKAGAANSLRRTKKPEKEGGGSSRCGFSKGKGRYLGTSSGNRRERSGWHRTRPREGRDARRTGSRDAKYRYKEGQSDHKCEATRSRDDK